jgi:hypothetical protein
MQRQEAKGFAEMIRQSIRESDVYTPAGVYIGRAPTFNANLKRIDATGTRILKGLYFLETGERTPEQADVAVYSMEGFQKRPDLVKQLWDKTRPIVDLSHGRKIGDTFSYTVHFAPCLSFWYLVFYAFYVMVGFVNESPSQNSNEADRVASENPGAQCVQSKSRGLRDINLRDHTGES